MDVYRQVQKAGIKCLVLKGMICRDLYVNPDARISGDEDLYIRKEDYRAFHKICEENGFCNLGNSEVEPAFFHEESGLKLEVHFELFNGQSESCGDLNKPFEHSLDHAIEIEIQKTKLWTMNETDHMLYLILHSFKHFIHSGFGVRQVCDIITYAEHYGDKIEWKYIFRELCKVKADIFLVNLFDIGKEYLGFSYGKAKLPRKLIENYADEIDSGALLKDLLAAGVYGSSSASRVHSSLITLNAVASSRQKRGIQGSIRRTIFPVSKEMESIYPYLKHNRLLLPAAWLQRILKYGKELADNKVGSRNSAWESISIGNQRIELMKKYKIIAK